MEFDKNRIYSAVNADELRAGDKVIVADTITLLKRNINNNKIYKLIEVKNEDCSNRFIVNIGIGVGYALAYLVERKENCTNCGNICSVPKTDKTARCWAYKPKTKKRAEPHYRPFRDTNELVKTWIAKRMITFPDLCLPHIWVRYKMNQCGQMGILITKYEKNYVQIEGDMIAMHALMADYEFLDGSTCGVEE